jgi:hypothetical protein
LSKRIVADFCSCPCGGAAFALSGVPLLRLICHCRICQTLYKAPYADVTVFWADAIKLGPLEAIDFRRYRLPPALRRGTCVTCAAPVLGFLRLAPMVRLAFVPTKNIRGDVRLPRPAMHIFYDRRSEDATDTLPKISGYWASEWAVSRALVAGMFRRDE